MTICYDDSNLYIERVRPNVTIPSKRFEDGCFDLYAAFDEVEMRIEPHTTELVPTGIKSAFSPKYRIDFRERGSNIKTHLIVRAGQIDSGFRAEWFVGAYNEYDKPIVISKNVDTISEVNGMLYIPFIKAICQFAFEEVPVSRIIQVVDVKVFESERCEGMLGASGK